jgi:perosamine synthetase
MKVQQSNPFIGKAELRAIKGCFDDNWFTEGPRAKEFTEKVCKMIGSQYGVLAPNGTLALYLGLRAIGIQPGDEVIVPNFTFIASANAVHMIGAKPVFVDIRKEDLQIDIEQCERFVTPLTKAIMPVHMFGQACNMDLVTAFADKHGLLVVEDAAQALGVTWRGKGCGSFGKVGCISFFADKTITTVEGGFVATDDKVVYEELIYLRNQGRLNRGTFIHPMLGFNFRMTDIQAAIGLEQLKKAPHIFKRRRENFGLYCEYLKDVEDVKVLRPQPGSNHVPYYAIVFCEGEQQDLSAFMKEKGIEVRTVFFPLHKQPCFSFMNLSDEHYGNSIWTFNHGLCLPVYPQLTAEQIRYTCDTIKEYYHV